MKTYTIQDAIKKHGKYGTVLNGKLHGHSFYTLAENGTIPRHCVTLKCECGAILKKVTITDRYGEQYFERVTEANGREWRVE